MGGDTTKKQVSLIFTGDEFREGLPVIAKTLKKERVPGSFFVTGKFLEDKASADLIKELFENGHVVGPHSDGHLLYSPWENRDSLLVSEAEFKSDLLANINELKALGISTIDKFVAPYEWYNSTIHTWTEQMDLTLYNFTPGLRTAADYTYPEMDNKYMSSQAILTQLKNKEKQEGLNGHIIIAHIGADPRRTDKFFNQLE
ncbi:MAG: polysaccharide deacetylase family protein, partial [Sphingobacterium sp.]